MGQARGKTAHVSRVRSESESRESEQSRDDITRVVDKSQSASIRSAQLISSLDAVPEAQRGLEFQHGRKIDAIRVEAEKQIGKVEFGRESFEFRNPHNLPANGTALRIEFARCHNRETTSTIASRDGSNILT